MEMSGQLHAPVALPLWQETWYPSDRRVGGHQSNKEKKFHHWPCWETKPGHPAHSL